MSTRASTRRKRALADSDEEVIVDDIHYRTTQNAQLVARFAGSLASRAQAARAQPQPDPKRARRSRSPSVVFIGIRRVAPAPFNDGAADLVIKTAAETEFMVYRSILAAASPVLANRIATAAERAAAEAPQAAPGSRLQIDLPESDFVLETLLRFIYPIPDPVLPDLDDIADVYDAAANRYSVACAVSALKTALASPRFLDVEPVRIYALAKRFGIDDLASIATRATLRQPAEWADYEEFQNMSAQDYHALLSTHRRIARDAVACLSSDAVLRTAATALFRGAPYRGKCPEDQQCWFTKFKECGQKVLLETPTSDRVCSPGFVAQLATEVQCERCRDVFLRSLLPGSYVEKLKAAIDALPAKYGL
ncbi:hypothetical protein ONZ51_g6109 [Trametes cubensis]|uniref:BTB domain-containing protein n=1 Tax=Trametes cubensis TaxID=1111947 RepID=A0AAD7X8P9_9APHY|nr:hypothetical protein ONZ51_g6109 [Trametes cubensis]